MNATLKPAATPASDFKVADLALADFGRKEIAIAETEMPGLMAIREEFAPTLPLRGARISGSLHMTIQTAVLIETLQALGATVRWASCNIFSTQDHAAAAIAAHGTAVFAWKGESLEDYWEYTHRIFDWPDGGYSNMILDDGGDATLLLHLGARAEGDPSAIAKPTSDEERALFGAIRARLQTDPRWYSTRLRQIRGVTEETTTGVKRLYQMAKEGRLAFPARSRWSAATAMWARAAVRRCGRSRPRCGSRKSIRSARCRPRWKATGSSPWSTRRTRPISS